MFCSPSRSPPSWCCTEGPGNNPQALGCTLLTKSWKEQSLWFHFIVFSPLDLILRDSLKPVLWIDCRARNKMQEPWLFSAKHRTITPLGQAMNKLQNTFEAMSMINRGKAPAWCQMEKIHAPDFFFCFVCLHTYRCCSQGACQLSESWQIYHNTVWLSVQTWSGD